MRKNYMQLFYKIIFALAPLAWGAFVWFMSWGWGSNVSYLAFNVFLRILIVFVFIYLFFGATLNHAVKNYRLQFFGYSIWLPSWRWFFYLLFLVVWVYVTPLEAFDVIQSLLGGVLISGIIEEFFARSFFVKYKMKFFEFFIFNIISSLAFTFMHFFYYQNGIDALTLLSVGHFSFSFALGLIVYKTQRIELAIILHMLSNFLRYIMPFCVFNCPYPSLPAIATNYSFEMLFYLCIAGCTYVVVNNKNKKVGAS